MDEKTIITHTEEIYVKREICAVMDHEWEHDIGSSMCVHCKTIRSNTPYSRAYMDIDDNL